MYSTFVHTQGTAYAVEIVNFRVQDDAPKHRNCGLPSHTHLYRKIWLHVHNEQQAHLQTPNTNTFKASYTYTYDNTVSNSKLE